MPIVADVTFTRAYTTTPVAGVVVVVAAAAVSSSVLPCGGSFSVHVAGMRFTIVPISACVPASVTRVGTCRHGAYGGRAWQT